MSDDLVKQLGRLARMAETANHWTDEHRLMPAPGVADIVYEAVFRIEELETKLTKALTALGDVQWFVRELEPYADQGHTLVPALERACATLAELTGDRE